MLAKPSARPFALLVGIFLLIEGVWGLFSPVVFAAFSTNTLHAAIHVVLGLWGVWAATRGAAVPFLRVLGALLLVVGVLWFIPATRRFPEELLNVNRAVAMFNVILGGVSLLVARDARARLRP